MQFPAWPGLRIKRLRKKEPVSVSSAILAFFLAALVFPDSPFPGTLVYAREKNNPTENTQTEKLTEHVLFLQVVLGDGRTATGKTTVRAPDSFIVEHINSGIRYEKKLTLNDIKEIRITRWKGNMTGENKNGKVYQFDPAEYEIELNDGVVLFREGEMFDFLMQFSLTNKNGMARFFTFWRDLLREDKTWYTGMSGPEGGFRTLPHKDVVRKIIRKNAPDAP